MKDIFETRNTLLEADKLRREIAGTKDWDTVGSDVFEGDNYIGTIKSEKIAQFIAKMRNVFVKLSNLTMIYRSKLADREAMVREMDDEE